jgi:ParB family chromosome partitioning protein
MDKKPQLAAKMFGNLNPNVPKIVELELTKIVPNPYQPRKTFHEESLRELADSINTHGLLQPITVKRDESAEDLYILVAGERRFRAHQILGRERVLSIVLKTGNIDELALIENLQREDLNPIEEAEALARLMDHYQYTQESLGKVVGKAQATVSNMLNLNKLPEQIKKEYSTSNTVSKSLLMEIARQENPQEQLRLWDAIKSGGVTVRATREAKKEKRQPDVAIMQIRRALSTGKSFVQKLAEIQDDTDFFGANQEIEKLTELHDQFNAYYHKVYADPWLSLQFYAAEMEGFLDHQKLQNPKHAQNANDAIKKAKELRDKLSMLLDKVYVEQ